MFMIKKLFKRKASVNPAQDKVEKKNEDSEKWDNKVEYLLSLIGYSIGLGNIWRFPAMAYKNGGGAFLIPYFIMYFCAGLPLYFLELSLGQFTGKSCASAFEMAPLFKGVGWSTVLISLVTSLYYNVIVAWCLHFLFASFRSKLNWSLCTNSWNDDSCMTRETVIGIPTRSIKNNISIAYCDKTTTVDFGNCTKGTFAASQYFRDYVLNLSDSIDNFGTPNWSLSLCLLLAWIIVVICLLFGIKSSGKVVYVTATFPYIVLLILLIRGVTLKGSLNGILYYIRPNFVKVLSIRTWFEAASQVFYSLGIGFGGIIMYSSYNRFNNNCIVDAATIVVVDCFTSVIGGFAIFSIIGYMSYANNIPIDEIAEAGTGLAFVIYPEVLAQMPVGPLFSILFFIMLFTLGLDSQFAMVETFTKSIRELFNIPDKHKTTVLLCCCTVLFLVGLCFCCPGGFYLFEILNIFSSGQALLAIGLIEICAVAYVYGFNNFMEDLKMMFGRRYLEYYWLVTWCFLTPILIFVIFVIMCITYETPVVNNKVLPEWSLRLGWSILAIILLPIPICFVNELYKAYKKRDEIKRDDMPLYLATLKLITKPSVDWKPLERENQVGRYLSKRLPEPNDFNIKEISSFDNPLFKF